MGLRKDKLVGERGDPFYFIKRPLPYGSDALNVWTSAGGHSIGVTAFMCPRVENGVGFWWIGVRNSPTKNKSV